MNILDFFILYFLLIIIGSFFINGWYTITRGYYELQPNGSLKKKGNIFMDWSFFWERKGTCVEDYEEKQVAQKMELLKSMRPDVAQRIKVSGGYLYISSIDDSEVIKQVVNCNLRWIGQTDGGFKYALFAELPQYRFPWWVRYPLSECVICMSSVYGSLFWWVFVWLQVNAFNWTEREKISYSVFWVIFIITLSAVNKFVHKIIA